MKGIYLLEMPDDASADDADDEKPRVSINAITGISSSPTMHLGVTLAGAPVRALVDSGSTHCFVNDTTAQRLGLVPLARPGLTVGVANGDRIACHGLCPDVPVQIDHKHFRINFYVIALSGYEVVLGCHWLRTLGPLLWDFDRLSLSFWRNGHRVS